MDLDIGTVEIVPAEKKVKVKKRSPLTGGGSDPGNGKRRGGGGGGDNYPNNDEFGSPDTEPFVPNKMRVGMWFLLAVVLMTFSALICAYVVVATNKAIEWRPFNLPLQLWVSTFVILASSATYELSNRARQGGRDARARKFLLATASLGAVFISSQILSWLLLVQRGVYVESNPYAGFFYILTAVHALHVLGGISALGYISIKTWHDTPAHRELLRRKTQSTVVGWYWHFMGALWLLLFLLLGFWK
jgi:cytochrome c oxidase subunit III